MCSTGEYWSSLTEMKITVGLTRGRVAVEKEGARLTGQRRQGNSSIVPGGGLETRERSSDPLVRYQPLTHALSRTLHATQLNVRAHSTVTSSMLDCVASKIFFHQFLGEIDKTANYCVF